MWTNFSFLHMFHVQNFEISPHDRFFSTGLARRPATNMRYAFILIVGGFNGFHGNGLIVGGLNGFYGNGLIVGGFTGFYGKRVIVGGFNGF